MTGAIRCPTVQPCPDLPVRLYNADIVIVLSPSRYDIKNKGTNRTNACVLLFSFRFVFDFFHFAVVAAVNSNMYDFLLWIRVSGIY